jgi:Ca2+-binding RTX toxin-like protein
MAIKKLKSDFIALSKGEVVDAIEPLANGNLVVTTHLVSTSGAVKYFDRLYSSTYALLSGPTAGDVAAYTSPPVNARSTASDAGDGTYWMQWAAPADATHTSAYLRGQHFNANGTRIGGETDLSSLGAAVVAGFSDGLVATGDVAAPLAFTNLIKGATTTLTLDFYSSDLATKVSSITLADNLDNGAQFIGAVSQGGGKLVVSWMEKPAGGNFAVKAALVDTTGNIAVQSNASHGVLDAEVDALPNGGYVLTCRETGTAGEKFQIKSYFYNATGTLTGTAKDITRSEPVYGKDYETVVLPDGRIAVMWVTADHHNASKTVLFLQYYDEHGQTISNEILIGYVPKLSAGINLHASLDSVGHLDVNWIGVDAGIQVKHSAVFDPLKFVPTDFYDWWVGTAANEILHGLGGNDEINGAGGRDTVYGDAGDDRIGGGAGADKLYGGAGFDLASYFFDDAVRVDMSNLATATGAAIGDQYFSIEGIEGSLTGADRLSGNAENNSLLGLGGDDILQGRGGDDWLVGGEGADDLSGGTGVDTASYYWAKSVKVSMTSPGFGTGEAKNDVFTSIENLEGSAHGSDELHGDGLANKIYGLGGNDIIHGGGVYIGDGGDTLYGGDGNDTLFAGNSLDVLIGGNGNDILHGGTNKCTLIGGAGKDQLIGTQFTDTVDYSESKFVKLSLLNEFTATGGAAGDTFVAIDDVYGSSSGADLIHGNNIANSIWGLGGNDRLFGMGGGDFISGGAGDDFIFGGVGRDDLMGSEGMDTIDGGTGKDMADYYNDKGLTVSLDGSVKNTGAAAGDKFISIENLGGTSKYADLLVGDKHGNYIKGQGGNDSLKGQEGNDGLVGGAGADTLYGGAGKDYFVYYDITEGRDKIMDFEEGDYFSLSANGFGFTGSGYLSDEYLTVGTHISGGVVVGVPGPPTVHLGSFLAFTTDDHKLWYVGSSGPNLIADLQNTYALKASDIYIF